MPRVAVIHDYFIQEGGAEIVAQEIYRALPGADLFSTVAFPDRMPEKLRGVPIRTTWMQNLPGIKRHYRPYFPIYPLAVRSLDLRDYDLVLSSTSGFAKAVRTRSDAVHICYCHTPPRWIWSHDSYIARESIGPRARFLLKQSLRGLKRWDEDAARRPDHFIANSKVVAARILKFYGRSSTVIYPPIDVDRFNVSRDIQDYYVVLARLVSYKRIDLAVKACTLLNKKLVVIGTGPDAGALRRMGGDTIKFLGREDNNRVADYVSGCRALIFPGEEDFGMAPLEVAAAGRPTIAFRGGGAVETVIEDRTGVFFNEQTPESVMAAIEGFESLSWNPKIIRQHARQFGVEVFRDRLLAFLHEVAGRATVPSHSASNHPAQLEYQSAD